MAWRDHLQSSRVRARTMFIASSPHLWLPLLLATICAALAYVIATRSLQAAEQRLVQQHAAHGRARQVIVAARRLSPGTRLEYDMLAQRAVPGQYVPRAALTVDQLDAAVGASPRVVLEPGDILVAGVLEPARHAALADRLDVGERALTITVDDAASQAGLLRPGDRIDLLYVEPPDRATDPLRIRPLLESVTVLATGRALDDPFAGESAGSPGQDGSTYSTVTLRVSVDGAQRIALAQRAGELVVSLRGERDVSVGSTTALDSNALRGLRARRSAPVSEGRLVTGWVGGFGGRLSAHRWAVAPATSGEVP